MIALKQGGWVKIHEQGQANFETAENVMDITVGDNCYQAEATYTAGTRTYRKCQRQPEIVDFRRKEM